MPITVFNVYVVTKEGQETYLCQCQQSDALAEVIKCLARFGRNGPAGFRIVFLEVES